LTFRSRNRDLHRKKLVLSRSETWRDDLLSFQESADRRDWVDNWPRLNSTASSDEDLCWRSKRQGKNVFWLILVNSVHYNLNNQMNPFLEKAIVFV